MTTLYCAILVAGFMATASLAEVNPQRMQRDIRIMEGVLGNLYHDHDHDDPTYFRPLGVCTSTATGCSFLLKDHGRAGAPQHIGRMGRKGRQVS